jgi:sugar phosphate isomerase/epimerase
VTTLGVFARVFPAGPAEKVAAAIRDAGFTTTQLNLSAVGRPTLDTDLDRSAATAIRRDFEKAGVSVWGVSGTFNAAHPDREQRRRSAKACLNVIRHAPDLGAAVVTLCTGTRDPDNMWRAHPENTSPSAWEDLLETLHRLLPTAAATGVKLGIEPEHGNVVRDADAAQRLIEDLGSDADHIAIVLDPANLLTPDTVDRQHDILPRAFGLLGTRTAAVQAKDVAPSGFAAPGTGPLDYELVFALHAELPGDVPVIAQDLEADDAPRVHRFLTEHADRAAR